MTARVPQLPRNLGRLIPGRPAPGVFARWYRRVRTAHPVDVLRWLRAGVLLCILATAAACLGVTLQASNDIGVVQSTKQAINAIDDAVSETGSANTTLQCTIGSMSGPKNCTVAGDVVKPEDVALTGLSTTYDIAISQVSSDLTVAAKDNGAGTATVSEILYVEFWLSDYQELSANAVTDYSQSVTFGEAGAGYAEGAAADLQKELDSFKATEQTALRAHEGTWSLNPRLTGFWWALASPLTVLLLLTAATARVLARHFRRPVSGQLLGAVAVAAATAAVLGFLNAMDAARSAADPWASHPATLTIAMLLFAAAAALAYRAYQPRLAEYLFRPVGEPGKGAS